MPVKISGTWFEFSHHNLSEGKYWNAAVKDFTDKQWEEKVDEIAGIGMKYIVLMCGALVYKDAAWAYFNTDIYPFADIAARDPIGALLRAADRHGIRVFMSCGFYGYWEDARGNMSDIAVRERAFRAMKQLYTLYKNHKSFYGWYLPDELGIRGCFDEEFISYVNDYRAFAKTLDKTKKMLIAPYGTNRVTADEKYVEALKRLDCDFIAYQDEVGVQKSSPDDTARYFAALKTAHDKAGRSALWADVEIFRFEGEVYRSALLPAKMSRIEKQLSSVSPFAEEILIYQYEGMFNKPGSAAFCGHPDSVRLYNDYLRFLEKNK